MARKRKKKKVSRFTATTANRFELYEGSGYDPEADHDFLIKTFQNRRKRRPLTLREDFAGTSLLSSLWVQNHGLTKAWAVDLDPDPLAYGKANHIEPLGNKAERVVQLEENVLSVQTPQVDVLTAFNFSYFLFRTRDELRNYLEVARKTLTGDGMLILDAYGGAEAQRCQVEKRSVDGFTYVWDQAAFDHSDGGLHGSSGRSWVRARGGPGKKAFVLRW